MNATNASRAGWGAVILGVAVVAACGNSTFPAFTGGRGGNDAGMTNMDLSGGGASGTGGAGTGGRVTTTGTGGALGGGPGGQAAGTAGAGSTGAATGGRGDGTGGMTSGTGGSGGGGGKPSGPTYRVTVTIVGGPAGTTITPTSSTPGATCAAASCQVPSGGSVMAVAPNLTDWFFTGWTGGSTVTTTAATLANVTGDITVTANYINQRLEQCNDQPPSGATTTDRTPVTTTYTTAGGWSKPPNCRWTCDPDYCNVGNACLVLQVDQISVPENINANSWYGGDDRPGFGPRSVGAGQSVTPTATFAMNRFGLNIGRFSYASNGKAASQPIILELDRRNASGVIQATYTTMVDPTWNGGWIYWDTPSTTLNSGTVYIFTSFVTNAFTQPVNAGVSYVSSDYTGGGAAGAEVTSGDLKEWSAWTVGTRDLLFRIQKRNPSCP